MVTLHNPRPVPPQPRLVDLAVERAKPARERARTAAAYRAGTVVFKPTIPNVPALFGVSATYIQHAERDAARDRPAAAPNLLSAWLLPRTEGHT